MPRIVQLLEGDVWIGQGGQPGKRNRVGMEVPTDVDLEPRIPSQAKGRAVNGRSALELHSLTAVHGYVESLEIGSRLVLH